MNLNLAQLTREELARAFRQGFDRDSGAMWLLMLFVIALALAMLWAYWRNRTAMHEGAVAQPAHLFTQLSRDLSLSLPDRWLLMRIARHEALPTPLTLLISPQTLRHHADAYGKSLSTFRRRRLVRRLARMRRTIFS